MDGRGRIAEPVSAPDDQHPIGRPHAGAAEPSTAWAGEGHGRLRRSLRRWIVPLFNLRIPRGAGIAATVVLIAGSVALGVFRGEHAPAFAAELADARDSLANTAGFQITSIGLEGGRHVSRDEILAAAGVTDRTSLLFLDAIAVRQRLKAHPWIIEATVLKLYPGRLNIEVIEREPFAMWQKDRKIAVIAADGSVVQAAVDRRFTSLPLVVGAGAETQAKDFLAILARFPVVRDQVVASVLVAGRRWNLRLKSGLDVKLPEGNVEQALESLVRLERDKKIFSRDIASLDLRLADRVTVRLSEQAAAARDEALKPKPKRKAGDA